MHYYHPPVIRHFIAVIISWVRALIYCTYYAIISPYSVSKIRRQLLCCVYLLRRGCERYYAGPSTRSLVVSRSVTNIYSKTFEQDY